MVELHGGAQAVAARLRAANGSVYAFATDRLGNHALFKLLKMIRVTRALAEVRCNGSAARTRCVPKGELDRLRYNLASGA